MIHLQTTYWCNQCDRFNSSWVLRSQCKGDDAAHRVADQMEGTQVQWLDKAPLDHLNVVFQSVHAVCRLGTIAEAEEINGEQSAVQDG